ncbi:hypothetical protein RFI_05102, partial [Reticulomyxa filosa]
MTSIKSSKAEEKHSAIKQEKESHKSAEVSEEAAEKEQEWAEKNPTYFKGSDNPKRFIVGDDYKEELARLQKMEKYRGKYAELYQRKISEAKTKNEKKQHLRIMQFNVLADGLSGLYQNSKMKDKAFVCVPEEALEFSYRGFRIVEEIMRQEPDVVTMEEVDQFE